MCWLAGSVERTREPGPGSVAHVPFPVFCAAAAAVAADYWSLSTPIRFHFVAVVLVVNKRESLLWFFCSLYSLQYYLPTFMCSNWNRKMFAESMILVESALNGRWYLFLQRSSEWVNKWVGTLQMEGTWVENPSRGAVQQPSCFVIRVIDAHTR